jgi:hypothetical protein
MLSQNMILWVSERVEEARRILRDERSTESQRTVALFVLEQWKVI